MATETVPADIAAAIDELVHRAEWGTCQVGDSGQEEARAALNAAILTHLRKAERCCDSYARENQQLSDKADELKAALERIEQGV